MFQKTRSFEEWQQDVSTDAAGLIQRFHQQVNALSPNLRKATFARVTDSETLQQNYDSLDSPNEARGVLYGIPYVLQDLFDVEDMPTACGAPLKELAADPAESSSFLYSQLEKLGAICFGKTQPSEFGISPQGRNPTYGDCPHPDSNNYVLGGGAGAAANAVRKGYVPLAFGMDTYGGVRIPAAFQGLFAFRMESNRFAREGVFPIAPTVDSMGFFTNTIGDLEKVFKVLYSFDLATNQEPVQGCFVPDISGAVTSEVKAGILKLTRCLHAEEDLLVSTELSTCLKGAKASLDIIIGRELYSVHRYWIEEYEAAYDPHLLQFIENGMECSPATAEGAHEAQLQVRSKLSEIFAKYDFIVLPISPEANPRKEEWSQEMEDAIIHLIAPASLAFLPALVLPFSCNQDRHSAAQILINLNSAVLG